MSEVALWRAVIAQAVQDSQMVVPPIPSMPLSREEVQRLREEALMLARRDCTEEEDARLTELTLQIKNYVREREKRSRIMDDRRVRDEAVNWLQSAGLDYKLVCEWAQIEPEYLTRKVA